jgi:hypothetical protein
MHTAAQPTALQQGTVFYFKAGRRVALQQGRAVNFLVLLVSPP